MEYDGAAGAICAVHGCLGAARRGRGAGPPAWQPEKAVEFIMVCLSQRQNDPHYDYVLFVK